MPVVHGKIQRAESTAKHPYHDACLYNVMPENYPSYQSFVKTKGRNLLAHGGCSSLAEISLLGLCFVDTLGEESRVLILRKG